jgi:hypothetical protein
MKLTQKTIAAMKLPKGKAEAIYFDDELPASACAYAQTGSRAGSSNTRSVFNTAA